MILVRVIIEMMLVRVIIERQSDAGESDYY